MIISLAPIQGFTEFPFRNVMNKFIGGIDKYYTPYLRFENDQSIKKKYINDILPQNNPDINLVPQILVNTFGQFLEMAKIISDYGYNEVNWNLGCPYPMVANRKLGSGLLPYPELIDKILSEVIAKININISVKLRSGYYEESEIFKIIEILNRYPLAEVIFHPRIGKQLYKGKASIEIFRQVHALSQNLLAYNGDIDSIEMLNSLQNEFPEVSHFMIGRAILKNPFLPNEIKNGQKISAEMARKKIIEFHNVLWDHYATSLSGNTHLLNKFIHFWEYFCLIFEEPRKIFKHLKKCHNSAEFETRVLQLIKDEPLNAHYFND